MTPPRFQQWAERARIALRLPDPPLTRCLGEAEGLEGHDAALEVGDVVFRFVYLPALAPDRLNLLVSYGPLPAERREAILHRILEINFVLHRPDGPAFLLDPSSQQLLLSLSDRIDALEGEALVPLLNALTADAMHWRTTHFLEAPESATAPSDFA